MQQTTITMEQTTITIEQTLKDLSTMRSESAGTSLITLLLQGGTKT